MSAAIKREHFFEVGLEWAGARADGAFTARGFGREHVITAAGKPAIEGSAARVFHGHVERWNPEELLIAALAQCHMLSFLFVAAQSGIRVLSYQDAASGVLRVEADGSGRLIEATLRPRIAVDDPEGAGGALALAPVHDEAQRLCFIANSVSFPVRIEPRLG